MNLWIYIACTIWGLILSNDGKSILVAENEFDDYENDYDSTNEIIQSRQLTASLPGTGVSISSSQEEQAKKISTSVRDKMKQLRGGTSDFYNKLYKALLITVCDQRVKNPGSLGQNPQVRYVPKEDNTAYRDANGNCILLSNPPEDVKSNYDNGFCEVAPNCYWSDFNATDSVRLEVYASDSSSMQLSDATQTLQKWASGLVVFVAPGIVLAVLTVLTMVFFIICRCCCNKCGGRDPNPNGYQCSKKFLPILFFIIFSAGIAVTAIISLVYSNQFTHSVSQLFNASEGTINDTLVWIHNARQPLLDINGTIFTASNNITVVLNNTDFIETGISTITNDLNVFDQGTNQATLPRDCDINNQQGQICVPCAACMTINQQISQVNSQMQSVSQDGLNMLKSTRDLLINQVAKKSNETSTTIDTNIRPTYDLENAIISARDQVNSIQKQYDQQDVYRAYGVLVLFILAVIVIAIGILGILFGITPLRCLACILHLAYFIGFFALFISFILAAILIALSIFLSDGCELANIMEKDWGPVMGRQASTGLNACFQNKSLLREFNLESSFDFTNQLSFNQTLDVESTLDFSQLNTFNTTISQITPNTFDLSMFPTQQLLSQFLLLTTINQSPACAVNDAGYTLQNIATPWVAVNDVNANNLTAEAFLAQRYQIYDSPVGSNPVIVPYCYPSPSTNYYLCRGAQQVECNYSTFVIELWKNITTIETIQTQSVDFVTNMKTNMQSIMTSTNSFKTNVRTLNNHLQVLVNDTVQSVIDEITQFKNSMYCTFVRTDFDEIMNEMCNDLIPALMMISLSIFLMGVFLIPVNICLIILAKRLRVAGNGRDAMIQNDF